MCALPENQHFGGRLGPCVELPLKVCICTWAQERVVGTLISPKLGVQYLYVRPAAQQTRGGRWAAAWLLPCHVIEYTNGSPAQKGEKGGEAWVVVVGLGTHWLGMRMARAWLERAYLGMFAHLVEWRAEVFGWVAWLHTCIQ